MSTNGRIPWGAKRKLKTIPIEEIGESITIRALSAEQLDSLKPDDENKTLRLIAMSLVDSDLKRMYVSPEEIAELNEMSMTIRKLISDEIAMLNGFSKEAIDEATKKSEPVPSTVSD